jgi:hypothetical protein
MELTTGLGKSLRAAAAVLLSACALVWSSGAANASLLPPNQTLIPAPAAADIGGTQVATETVPIIYGSGSLIAGTLTSTVDVNDPSNPFYSPTSPGELTFIFMLASSASSTTPINELTVNGFVSVYSVDGSYIPGTGTTTPTYLSRSNSGLVNFAFETPSIAAGQTSMTLVLHTNATQYTNANPIAAIIGNAGIANAPTYMPAPEPSSLILASIGTVLVLGVGWRRHQRRQIA